MSDQRDPIPVPRDLLEALLDNTYELRGERSWWKDEPRLGRDRAHQAYCNQIDEAAALLGREEAKP